MNERIIAPCGIVCSACEALTATLNNDNKMREEMAAKWSSPEQPINPADINCLGCLHPDTRIGFTNECAVRKCAVERGVETCAHCGDYACETLEKHWQFLQTPGPRETLDALRASLQ